MEGNVDEVWLSFNTSGVGGGGWGIKVENSSGSIQRLRAQGVTPNGLISIRGSNNFSLGYVHLWGTSSHTFDIQNSSNINIHNSEVQSSAGAIEVAQSRNINITNNKIHNSATALSVYSSSNVKIKGNLIYRNRESGLYASNIQNMQVVQNTFVNNSSFQSPSNTTIHLTTDQGVGSGYEFRRNIIFGSGGIGISLTGNHQPISVFSRNDVYANNINYVGYNNQTGKNGNISQDPLLNTAYDINCPSFNSPVVYGNVANFEYMGYIGPCSPASPSPSPSPLPSPSPAPDVCTPNNKIITVTPDGGSGTCHDIQTAVNAITEDGFKIVIAGGTYNVPIINDFYVYSLQIKDKQNLSIEGSTDPQNPTILHFNDTVNNFSGLLITDSTGSLTNLRFTGSKLTGNLIELNSSHDYLFDNLNIDGGYDSGLSLDAANTAIQNSTIKSVTNGLVISFSDNVVVKNNIIKDSNTGILSSHNINLSLNNNLITKNKDSALILQNNTDTKISYNTIVYNGTPSSNIAAIEYKGQGNSNVSFVNNIIAYNKSIGIFYNNAQQNFSNFSHNDVYNYPANSSLLYKGMANKTGINGNISEEPQLTDSFDIYCPTINSPVIYGDIAKHEYMGYKDPCGYTPASPSPSPTSTPFTKLGDVNGDNKVNMIDIGIVVDNYDSTILLNPKADIDGNGKVDIVDIGIIIDRYEF